MSTRSPDTAALVGFGVSRSAGVKARLLRWLVRAPVAVLVVIGAALLIVDSTPLANLLAKPLLVPSLPVNADVAIVLAAGIYDDGSLDEASLERTITGVRLYYQGLAPRLLFSGGPCCGRGAGARMANLAGELGVPAGAILLEEQSTRTYENALYSTALLRRFGVRSALLVTSPLHMLRAGLAFEKAGFPVHVVSASERDLTLVSATHERIALLHDVFHEYVGLAFYRLRGWI